MPKPKVFFVSAIVMLIIIIGFLFGYYIVSTVAGLECPIGHLPCHNSSQCIEKRFVCDKKKDCLAGDDEFKCYVLKLLDPLNKGNENRSQERITPRPCNLSNWPIASCKCKSGTRLFCAGAGMTKIPSQIRGNLTKLIFANNSVSSLYSETFVNYSLLDDLRLPGNGILEIKPNAFHGLKSLKKLTLHSNNLTTLSLEVFDQLTTLRVLDMNKNQLGDLDLSIFRPLTGLTELHLSNNYLTLKNASFPQLDSLQWLDLSHNEIEVLNVDVFRGVPSLEVLNLDHNKIQMIHYNVFQHHQNMTHLFLRNNQLKSLKEKVFNNLISLNELDISYNPLIDFHPRQVEYLPLLSLLIKGIHINNISRDMFHQMDYLLEIDFEMFDYCRYVPNVRICRPNTDGLSSQERLLSNTVQMYSVWAIGIITILGNFMVILCHVLIKETQKSRSHHFYVFNLAVADLLMGIYLLVIGVTDHLYQAQYYRQAYSWMSSWKCTVTGFIGTVSSEASIITLCMMTIERKQTILNVRRTSGKYLAVTGLGIWVTAAIIAIVPMFIWRSPNEYYGNNGVCIPLHINDPYGPGWEYSTIVLLGVNPLCVTILILEYITIIRSVQVTQYSVTAQRQFKSVGIRVMAIVTADCLCWIPIFVIKLIALTNNIISDSLNSWIVIFVMPINSAINPFLFTLTTTTVLKELSKHKLVDFFSRLYGAYTQKRTTKLQLSTIKSNSDHKIIQSVAQTNGVSNGKLKSVEEVANGQSCSDDATLESSS